MAGKPLAKDGLQGALRAATPGAIDGESDGQAVRAQTYIKPATLAAILAAVENVQVVIRFIRALVLAEADVAIDAGEVTVGLAADLKLRIELQQKRLQHCQ